MNTIVIEVSGGVVSAVYANDPDVKIILVDWDNIESGERVPLPYHPDPLSDLPTETANEIPGNFWEGSV